MRTMNKQVSTGANLFIHKWNALLTINADGNAAQPTSNNANAKTKKKPQRK